MKGVSALRLILTTQILHIITVAHYAKPELLKSAMRDIVHHNDVWHKLTTADIYLLQNRLLKRKVLINTYNSKALWQHSPCCYCISKEEEELDYRFLDDVTPG